MLKIITNLTDEEMAKMKFRKRLLWHWRGWREGTSNMNKITDEEMADRGLEQPKTEFIEYVKRPPHDKYL